LQNKISGIFLQKTEKFEFSAEDLENFRILLGFLRPEIQDCIIRGMPKPTLEEKLIPFIDFVRKMFFY